MTPLEGAQKKSMSHTLTIESIPSLSTAFFKITSKIAFIFS